MYAVVATGGKQYKVSEGDIIYVEKLEAEVDSTIELDKVLMVNKDEGLVVGKPVVEGSVNSGMTVADKFISATAKGKKSSIKIIHQMPYSYPKEIMDITEVLYDGENYYGVKYIPTDYYSGTPGFYYKFRFKYIKTFDISTYKFVYLLEDNKITFNDIAKRGLSKDPKDWVDYHFLYDVEK